jgi:hypothetical protein
LRVKPERASVSDSVPFENTSVGGPQLIGSWSLPTIPASPETLTRLAKNGVVSFVSCVNWTRGRIEKN